MIITSCVLVCSTLGYIYPLLSLHLYLVIYVNSSFVAYLDNLPFVSSLN
jgi:hypothetical protein